MIAPSSASAAFFRTPSGNVICGSGPQALRGAVSCTRPLGSGRARSEGVGDATARPRPGVLHDDERPGRSASASLRPDLPGVRHPVPVQEAGAYLPQPLTRRLLPFRVSASALLVWADEGSVLTAGPARCPRFRVSCCRFAACHVRRGSGLLGLRQPAAGAELLHRPGRAELRPRPARRGRQRGRLRVPAMPLQPSTVPATPADAPEARPDDPRARHLRDRRRHDPRSVARAHAPAALHRAPDRDRHARGLRRRRVRRPQGVRAHRAARHRQEGAASPRPHSGHLRPLRPPARLCQVQGGTDAALAQLRAGWAKVYVYGGRPFQRVRTFSRSERSPRRARPGVWRRCRGRFHTPARFAVAPAGSGAGENPTIEGSS
jgi:hypothetical protein